MCDAGVSADEDLPAALLNQLPADVHGRQLRMAQVLEPRYPHVRRGQSLGARSLLRIFSLTLPFKRIFGFIYVFILRDLFIYLL